MATFVVSEINVPEIGTLGREVTTIVRADNATEARVIGAQQLGVSEGDVTVQEI